MKDEQHTDLKQDTIDKLKKADMYIAHAERLKRAHERIKYKKGVYKLLDKLICWGNIQYYKRGMAMLSVKSNDSSIEIDKISNTFKG